MDWIPVRGVRHIEVGALLHCLDHIFPEHVRAIDTSLAECFVEVVSVVGVFAVAAAVAAVALILTALHRRCKGLRGPWVR